MKFMLLLYRREGEPPPPDLFGRMAAYREALAKAGAFIDSAPFAAASSGKVLLGADGEMQVHDGPYADTKEQIGGYFIIEVPSLDDAIRWARGCPSVATGPVEIRPFLPGF
jgi:hypothetical protein